MTPSLSRRSNMAIPENVITTSYSPVIGTPSPVLQTSIVSPMVVCARAVVLKTKVRIKRQEIFFITFLHKFEIQPSNAVRGELRKSRAERAGARQRRCDFSPDGDRKLQTTHRTPRR